MKPSDFINKSPKKKIAEAAVAPVVKKLTAEEIEFPSFVSEAADYALGKLLNEVDPNNFDSDEDYYHAVDADDLDLSKFGGDWDIPDEIASLRVQSRHAPSEFARQQIENKISRLEQIYYGDDELDEEEGDCEGLPHLTPDLAKHISQQIDTEGPHAVEKSIEWGDGAADELLAKIKEMLDDYAGIANETAAWQKKSGKNKNGGLNQKGVDSYRREHPGSKLQTAVTTKPSKLKPGSKSAKRRKSFCARMGGMKGPMKDEHGKPTRKALALRKWHCESAEQFGQLIDDHLEKVNVLKEACWDNYKQIGMKTKNGKKVPNCVPKGDVDEGVWGDTAKLVGIPAVAGALAVGANHLDQQQPHVDIGGQSAKIVNYGPSQIPDYAMTLQGKDGKMYRVWTTRGNGGGHATLAVPTKEVKEAGATFRAGNSRRAAINAMSPDEQRAYDLKRQEQQRKRDDARMERERQRNAEKKGVAEAGDTAKGQEKLARVHHRAANRVTSKQADKDPAYARKAQQTQDRAWDRLAVKEQGVAEAGEWTKLPNGNWRNMHTGAQQSTPPKTKKPRRTMGLHASLEQHADDKMKELGHKFKGVAEGTHRADGTAGERSSEFKYPGYKRDMSDKELAKLLDKGAEKRRQAEKEKQQGVSEAPKDSAPKMGSQERKMAAGAVRGGKDMSAALGLVRGKDGVATLPNKKLKENATGGATGAGSVAVSFTREGNMPNEIIQRQKNYTNQRTKGGTVKVKASK